MDQRFPGESKEYRDSRNYLKQLEVAARRALEEAAAVRRRLPKGGAVPKDYVFEEVTGDGSIRKVKMSELFVPGENSLAIYSYMFGEGRARPCPMCTAMIDTWEGATNHVNQRVPLVIVAGSDARKLHAWTKERGWKNLRVLSIAGSTYNKDYFGIDDKGNDQPILNVFRKDASGAISHFWGAEDMGNDVGQDGRNLDTLNPIFQFFDVTPEGRGDFYTKLHYYYR